MNWIKHLTILEDFYKKHSMLEYKNAAGVETLLSNNLSAITTDRSLLIEDRYPFKELLDRVL